jgi:hypothetical protein
MEGSEKGFDIKDYQKKVSLIGGEVHITNVTEAEADQIVEYAKSKGIEARKDELSDEEANRMNFSKKATVYLGHTVGSEKKIFED